MFMSKTLCLITDVKKRCWEHLYFVNGRNCILLGHQPQCTDWLAGFPGTGKSVLNKTDWKLKICFPVWDSLALNFTLYLLL